MGPTGEEKVIRFQPSLLDSCLQCVSGSSRDLKQNCGLGLVLHNDGAFGQLLTMAHVVHLEGAEVTSEKLAVDTEIDECELANPSLHLSADTQRPDVFQFEGRVLSDDLSLVPRLAMNNIAGALHDALPSS